MKAQGQGPESFSYPRPESCQWFPNGLVSRLLSTTWNHLTQNKTLPAMTDHQLAKSGEVPVPPRLDGPVSARKPDSTPKARPALALVAEDRTFVRRLIRSMLEAEGFRVVEAADGADALKMARASTETIDLLMSDVVMPGPSGTEVAEHLATEGLISRVILCSGLSGAGEVVQPDGVRRYCFLAKPFSRKELRAAVAEVFALEERPLEAEPGEREVSP